MNAAPEADEDARRACLREISSFDPELELFELLVELAHLEADPEISAEARLLLTRFFDELDRG